MMSLVIGQATPAREEPARASEEISALSQRLEDAYERRDRLIEVGAATDAVDREIRELKRQLREGGRLIAGDMLGNGRYVLVEELGRGGFAVVWKAKDKVAKRDVAIKVLHANLAGDTIRRERFYRGARAMQRLQHPGVVRVLDPEAKDGGFCYFVMELVRNGNLHDAVVRKRVPGDVVLGHILRVGEALAEAHSRGMIHRDVKPQNILLDEGFEAKLTDFDLVGAKDTTGGTRTGAMGTVIYAAPECLDKPQEATARVDVFGLGMTAIFGLAGRALTLSTLRNAEPTIAGLDCSGAVKEVLRCAVAWEPEARYADAGAMVSALRAAMCTEMSTADADAYADVDFDVEALASEMLAAMSADSGVSPLPAVPMAPGSLMPPSPADVEALVSEILAAMSTDSGVSPLPAVPMAPGALMPPSPSAPSAGRDDSQVFLERLNKRVGELFARLPTEAEWERACRGGKTGATWVGELSGLERAPELGAIAWYQDNSSDQTHPVGRKAANPYGLYDMLGNVWEWCADVVSSELPKYSARSETDPVATRQGSSRVRRGGSWSSLAKLVRAALRDASPRDSRDFRIGFRLAGGQVSASR